MKRQTHVVTPLKHGTLRHMRAGDVEKIMALAREAFAGIPEDRLWKPEQIRAHVERFPDGQWVIERGGEIIGSATNLRTSWERATTQHRWSEITGAGSLRTHDPEGDTLYGTEIMVSPRARKVGVGRRLLEARYRYVVDRGLRGFVSGGRIPGFRDHFERMGPHEYIEKVTLGDLADPVLTPQLKWGLKPVGLFAGYLTDPASCHYASTIVWENPEYSSRT